MTNMYVHKYAYIYIYARGAGMIFIISMPLYYLLFIPNAYIFYIDQTSINILKIIKFFSYQLIL